MPSWIWDYINTTYFASVSTLERQKLLVSAQGEKKKLA